MASRRAFAAAFLPKPCNAKEPLAGSASGLDASPVTKRLAPAIDVTTGKDCAATWSAMRPPQPERLAPVATDDCHWFCWSACEKRLSGRFCRYVALVVGSFRGPTFASTA